MKRLGDIKEIHGGEITEFLIAVTKFHFGDK